jgi:hypothetical protein
MKYKISILMLVDHYIDHIKIAKNKSNQVIILNKVDIAPEIFIEHSNIKVVDVHKCSNDVERYMEGLNHVEGEYVIFSHPNVTFQKNALKILLSKAHKSRGKIITSSVEFFLLGPSKKKQYLFFSGEHRSKIYFYNFINECATLIHISVFKKVGLLDVNAPTLNVAFHNFWQKALIYFELYGVYQVLFKIRVEKSQSYNLLTPVENKYLNNKTTNSLALQSKENDLPDSYNGKYILVIAEAMTASLELLLSGLPSRLKEMILYRLPNMVDDKTLLESSCVLFIRSSFNAVEQKLLARCYKYKVPVYYYFDDNFWEIPSYSSNKHSIYFSVKRAGAFFKDFAGLVTSSQPLYNFASEFFPAEKIRITYPIICNDTNVIMKDNFEGYTFAFIGGIHRLPSLREVVFPAINSLVDKFRIRFIFAGFTSDILADLSSKVERVFIEQTYFYTSFIEKLQSYKIDFLIHPSTPHPNLKNKTLNAILNAYVLDAVAILTDLPPYSDIKEKQIAMLVNNTSSEWYDAISTLLGDKDLYRSIKANNCKYSLTEFSPRRNEDVILDIIKESNELKSKNYPLITIDSYEDFPLPSSKTIFYKIVIWKILKKVSRSSNFIYAVSMLLLQNNLVKKIIKWLSETTEIHK